MSAPLQVRFVASATRVSQLPDLGSEVAFVGRSNVGKSSLINALANTRQLARVSNTPGRTQHLNVFAHAAGGALVDLPGASPSPRRAPPAEPARAPRSAGPS